jgi:hypothetical protein
MQFVLAQEATLCILIMDLMPEPHTLRGFHQGLHKIFSQGMVEDHDQDLHARTPRRISQDCH